MMVEIVREAHSIAVERLLRDRRAVLLYGARQVGKTTLARQIGQRRKTGKVTYFTLAPGENDAALGAGAQPEPGHTTFNVALELQGCPRGP